MQLIFILIECQGRRRILGTRDMEGFVADVKTSEDSNHIVHIANAYHKKELYAMYSVFQYQGRDIMYQAPRIEFFFKRIIALR